ncbi:MAG: NUDIX domain-containing protein [Clostridium sp.]|uniref:NUDIX domain-containing protein n=1 Tax=Clostridium sp. TaxID=1506 RepID=UPI003D6D6618
MDDNRYLAVSGIVIRDNKVLLVRQSYGSAKGLLIIPGGYLQEKEMPDKALEREIFEETGIVAKARSLVAIRFSPQDWWGIFLADYISGESVSDDDENSEAVFINIEEALKHSDLTYTTKEILSHYNEKQTMCKTEFCPAGVEEEYYQLFM